MKSLLGILLIAFISQANSGWNLGPIKIPEINLPTIPKPGELLNTIEQGFNNVAGQTQNMLASTVNSLTDQFKNVQTNAENSLNSVKNDITASANTLASQIKSLPDKAMQATLDQLRNAVENLAKDAMSAVNDVSATAGELWKELENEIAGATHTATDKIKNIGDGLFKDLKKLIENKIGNFQICNKEFVPKITKFVEDFTKGMLSCPIEIKNQGEAIYANVTNVVKSVPQRIQNIIAEGTSCVQAITNPNTNVLEKAKASTCAANVVKDATTSMKDIVSTLYDLKVRTVKLLMNSKRDIGLCTLEKVLETCAKSGDIIKDIRDCVMNK